MPINIPLSCSPQGQVPDSWVSPCTLEPAEILHSSQSPMAQWVESLPAMHRRCRFNPWVGKILRRRKWKPTPALLPGESHGQRSLEGYSLWGHTGLDMTEQLSTHSTQSWVCLPCLAHGNHTGWCPYLPMLLLPPGQLCCLPVGPCVAWRALSSEP